RMGLNKSSKDLSFAALNKQNYGLWKDIGVRRGRLYRGAFGVGFAEAGPDRHPGGGPEAVRRVVSALRQRREFAVGFARQGGLRASDPGSEHRVQPRGGHGGDGIH